MVRVPVRCWRVIGVLCSGLRWVSMCCVVGYCTLLACCVVGCVCVLRCVIGMLCYVLGYGALLACCVVGVGYGGPLACYVIGVLQAERSFLTHCVVGHGTSYFCCCVSCQN